MSRSAVIFLNGNPPSAELIKKHLYPDDLLICTDGAYDYLKQYGIRPDVLIGDMDSISVLPDPQDIEIVRSADQTNNDLEKALIYSLEHHISSLRIFAADGKRLDHVIINLATLEKYALYLSLSIICDNEFMQFLSPGDHIFEGFRGKRFSILALHKAEGLTLKGAVYGLTDSDLEPGSLGLSNAFSADEVQISFKSGLLLYMTE
ncbi:MAG: thiamine diphosphokinase [FCB group bacterium]|nr:thiamine diphosphokinase [FCB group bacterium]